MHRNVEAFACQATWRVIWADRTGKAPDLFKTASLRRPTLKYLQSAILLLMRHFNDVKREDLIATVQRTGSRTRNLPGCCLFYHVPSKQSWYQKQNVFHVCEVKRAARQNEGGQQKFT